MGTKGNSMREGTWRVSEAGLEGFLVELMVGLVRTTTED